MVEQPSSSTFLTHPAMEFLRFRNLSCPAFWLYSSMPKTYTTQFRHMLLIAKVYIHRWWMMHWSSPTPKREVCLSNNRHCSKFDKGKLSKDERKVLSTGVKTTRRYQDGTGRTRYVGTAYLKKSQPRPQSNLHRSRQWNHILERQVAQNNRLLYPKVAHNTTKVAPKYRSFWLSRIVLTHDPRSPMPQEISSPVCHPTAADAPAACHAR